MKQSNSFWKIININAAYEIRLLLRSWFFRIFAILSVLFISGMGLLFFASFSPVPRFVRSLDSFYPYFMIAVFNFTQMVLTIFLASDVFKRDRKFNSSDVIWIRPMSNLAMQTGRALGIFVLFALLNLIILLIGLIFNLLLTDFAVHWTAYLIYPVLISFPVLLFTIGSTFFLMQLIRNQAVVIVIMIGLLASTMFFLGDRSFMLLDISALKFPLTISDFTGIDNLKIVIFHRLFWGVAGLTAFIFSIPLIKRLPQSKSARIFIYSSMVILPLFLFYLGYAYRSYWQQGEDIRAKHSELSKLENQNIEVKKHTIVLNHKRNIVEIEDQIVFQYNDTTEDSVYFCLNPGFEIEYLKLNNQEITFNHEGYLVSFSVQPIIKEDNYLDVKYEGFADDRFMYPEIKERVYNNYVWLYRLPVKHSYISSDYLLLTPKSNWYPQFHDDKTYETLKPFFDFDLKVNSRSDLRVITQGKNVSGADSLFRFFSESPVKGLDLIIGKYEKESVIVDSIEFALFRHPGHDYFKESFKEIGDTLAAVIKEQLNEFEVKTGFDYPFERFYLIEVPASFHAYHNGFRENAEMIQPAHVYINENSVLNLDGDFKRHAERQERWGNRGNQTFTDLEKEIMMFKRFMRPNFMEDGSSGGDTDLFGYYPKLNIYPHLLHFSNRFKNKNAPFAWAIEGFLRYNAVKDEGGRRSWRIGELTDQEKANLALNEKMFKSIVDSAANQLKANVITQAGHYFFKMLEYKLGTETFNEFIDLVVENKRFQKTSSGELEQIFSELTNLSFNDEISSWKNVDQLAGYKTNIVNYYKVQDEDRIRYQVIFDIFNPTETDGLIEVSFRQGRRGGRGFRGDDDEPGSSWLYFMPGGGGKRIGLVLDEEPRAMMINTLLSQNLPAVKTIRFDEAELRRARQAFEGEQETEGSFQYSLTGEIVADDLDSTFSSLFPEHKSVLRRLVRQNIEEESKDYDYLRWWRGPAEWLKIKFPSFHGNLVNAAHYTRSGGGERKASWLVDLPEDGFYQVYVYVPDENDFRMRWRDDPIFKKQKYKIYHEDGSSEIEIDFENAQPGWNYLETYYFDKGTAEVSLSDESDGRLILADAVKWVKQN